SLSNSDPLTVAEVKLFLSNVADWYRDLYDVWFRVGWRPSEILAIRFEWIDFHRQTVHLKRGRIARRGGVEAPPKTGEREVDCSYDPAILMHFERLKRRSLQTGKRDFVFTDECGAPLSHAVSRCESDWPEGGARQTESDPEDQSHDRCSRRLATTPKVAAS